MQRKVQRFANRLLWFVGLYVAGVAVTALLALGLRSILVG